MADPIPQGWTLEPAAAEGSPAGWTLEPMGAPGSVLRPSGPSMLDRLLRGGGRDESVLPEAKASMPDSERINSALAEPSVAARGAADMVPFSHKLLAALATARDVGSGSDLPISQRYGSNLKNIDADFEANRQDPVFRAGQIGAALSLPTPKTLPQMIALGASQGAGDARGSLTNDAIGGTAGGAIAATIFGAMKLPAKAMPYLEELALKYGRKALAGGGAISTAKKLGDPAVREALDSGAITFGGTASGAADRLQALRGAVGNTYGEIVQRLEAAGIAGPEARVLAQSYMAEQSSTAANTMNNSVPKVFGDAASSVLAKPTDASGRFSLTQTENLKRSLQDMAQSSYKKLEPTELGSAQEKAASMMRQATEDAIDQGVNANRGLRRNQTLQDLAASFVPVKQRLGNLIEASQVANEAASRAARNKSISLTDTIAGAAGLAHGDPLQAMAATGVNKFLRERGASSGAVTMDLASKLAQMASQNPQALGRFASPLTQASARGADALAAHHFVMSQDPEYQALAHKLAEDGQ